MKATNDNNTSDSEDLKWTTYIIKKRLTIFIQTDRIRSVQLFQKVYLYFIL